MILVVLAHVFLMMSPRHWDGSPVAAVLMSFRMPLFFMVSGFFAYKAAERWTSNVVADIMVRKVRAQVLCATLFFMLFQAVNNAPVFAFIDNGYGYFWFTIALFQMFVAYVALSVLGRAVLRRDVTDWVMAAMIAGSVVWGNTPVPHGVGVTLSWHQVLTYMQFFATGVLVRRHWGRFEALLRSDVLRTLAVVAFVGGCFWFYSGRYHQPHTWGEYMLQGVLHRYAGLLTVLVFFHSRSEYFDGSGAVARFLRFTGQRTLDIYMMHMFFMPKMAALGWVNTLEQPSMVVLKLGVAVPVALGIVALCLLCSSVLRSSHTLSVCLFGVRNRQRREAAALER